MQKNLTDLFADLLPAVLAFDFPLDNIIFC